MWGSQSIEKPVGLDTLPPPHDTYSDGRTFGSCWPLGAGAGLGKKPERTLGLKAKGCASHQIVKGEENGRWVQVTPLDFA